MRITGFENNEVILRELGQRIKDTRIAMNDTQSDLAEKSGVALSTLSRMERGESVGLENLLNILRALGALPNLELLLQEQTLRPTDIADRKTKRKRASKSGKASAKNTWVWGDEKT
ncbi:MAG: helix-turn-helix domain-containing protein [Lachnospiraceae bacterium]|nr:helix-turn-helix domain-containing protein [Lachnospiraceae bacterium]